MNTALSTTEILSGHAMGLNLPSFQPSVVDAGRAALRAAQRVLAQNVEIAALEMVAAVDVKRPSYRTVIGVIQWTTLCAFTGGFIYAAWPAVHAGLHLWLKR